MQSCGNIEGTMCGVRPVVCLEPDVKFVKSDTVVGDGENQCFEIVK